MSKFTDDEQAYAREIVKMIILQIATVNTDTLREINSQALKARDYWDTLGVMIDPTAYKNMLHEGSFDEAQKQREIVTHLIAVREIAEEIAIAAIQRKATA